MRWCDDWVSTSPVFEVLDGIWEPSSDGSGWPTLEQMNRCLTRVGGALSAAGAPIVFVPQGPKVQTLEGHYESRIYHRGEVQTRLEDWHDFFNALTWCLFPLAKAAVNAMHYEALVRDKESLYTRKKRSPEEDMLTLLHESGVLVVSSDPSLLSLMREFQWEELFWDRRKEVVEKMAFWMFGHALYEKFLTPYVGLTGHSILYQVEDTFWDASPTEQRQEVDRLLAADFAGDTGPSVRSARDFAPFPMLGFPGLVPESEVREYYHNTRYFRPGRRH